MKYIDAERLKRSVESIGLIPQKRADYNDGRNDVKMMVLDLIDSLQEEQPEVDLEKAIDTFFEGWTDSPDYCQALNAEGECVSTDEIIEIARHFGRLNARK